MIELYQGSCADLLPLFSSCDVQISDLPYRARVHEAATSQSTGGGTRFRDLGFSSVTPALYEVTAYAASQVRRWSLVYSDTESTGEIRKVCEAHGTQYIRIIPWIRWSMPQLTGTMPPQGWEAVSIFHRKEKKHWNGSGNLLALRHEDPWYPELLALEHKCLRGEDKHKTEKPLDQLLDLVSWFSDPGETILDLTAGRGTTAVACVLLGRNFLGAELDPEEHERAQERISKAQGRIFSDRDQERIRRYKESVLAEDSSKLTPPAQARAAKRRGDAERIAS